MGNILLIDGLRQDRRMLELLLVSNGYSVLLAGSAREGLFEAANSRPELILIDLQLPDESGLTAIRKLREWYRHPLMVVSSKCREKDIIESLDAGANDFISKPFQNGELLARIRTAFRNLPSIVPEPVISNKNFEMNLVTRTVKVNKEILRLTAIQYQLLAVLVKNEGKTLNHNYLLNEIWGKEFINEFQYLRVFIAQLRKKLEQFPDCGLSISTESGVGYRFIMK